MTYALAWPLQQALFAALSADAVILDLAGGRVHDAPPRAAQTPFVLLGDERARPWSTATDEGAEHEVTIAVVGAPEGFGALKRIAAAVTAVATGDLTLARGRIVVARLREARARRVENGARRRIDLRLNYLIEDTI